jgi:hypothetical protein
MAEREYIERGAALNAILGQPPEPHYPEWYYRDIKELPAADVVEVVRCKDCKHYKPVTPTCGNCFLTTGIQRPKYFCSRGERKEATP